MRRDGTYTHMLGMRAQWAACVSALRVLRAAFPRVLQSNQALVPVMWRANACNDDTAGAQAAAKR